MVAASPRHRSLRIPPPAPAAVEHGVQGVSRGAVRQGLHCSFAVQIQHQYAATSVKNIYSGFILLPGEAFAYYGGIAAATAIFGVWEMTCVWRFFSKQSRSR